DTGDDDDSSSDDDDSSGDDEDSTASDVDVPLENRVLGGGCDCGVAPEAPGSASFLLTLVLAALAVPLRRRHDGTGEPRD
ncbi:MAG TPA: hypothetical protein DIU15_12545, partial [Deltaproteobacteria bacterium]|nr:hypothetical protein [Deltaproteobacteria bacterium]